MTAKGKINASRVQINDRIIVQVDADGTVQDSYTKTGEGVQVARVIGKQFGPVEGHRSNRYTIMTTAGSFDAAPIQTMFLAPEDPAGIKRAHAEALEEAVLIAEAEALEAELDEEEAQTENEAPGKMYGPDALRLLEPARVLDLLPPRAAGRELVRLSDIAPSNPLTLNSQAGKVDLNSETDAGEGDMTTETSTEIHTGSTVVALIERVWDRIRTEHPELPQVVVTTGSGEGVKWGHFRPSSWRRGKDGEKMHEFFLSSEALAKGPHQVLQTTIHEAAHTLSNIRGLKDTSRQNRYHNGTFRKTAEELGLEYRRSQPDKTTGFSGVTLTEKTRTKYATILADLERELILTGLLPSWLGGTDGEDENGGERITGKPKGEDGEKSSQSGPLKATCNCVEPNIIRLSRKVLDKRVVSCDDCDSVFQAAD